LENGGRKNRIHALILALVFLPLSAFSSPARGDEYAVYEERINQAISKKMIYESVIQIGRRDEVLFQKAYGRHMKKVKKGKAEEVPPDVDDIYDIASITKPVAMATSILILYDMGEIGLEDRIGTFLPEFKGSEKENISVLQLLTHTSGFGYNHTSKSTPEKYLRYAKKLPLHPTGNKMSYSGVNYTLLQIILERLTGETLDEFSRKQVFHPLKMTATMYNPGKAFMDRVVPNKNNKGAFVWGKPMGGMARESVSGRYGLFSTAGDLARYSRMIINQGELDGIRVLKERTCKRMVSEKLGWWYFARSDASIFHGGASGAMMYVNPDTGRYLVFLSNGVHSYFKERNNFRSFLEGFAELAEGKELGSIRKLNLYER
jgi:CubicO group peptidase (beta-lactamase class C family)